MVDMVEDPADHSGGNHDSSSSLGARRLGCADAPQTQAQTSYLHEIQLA